MKKDLYVLARTAIPIFIILTIVFSLSGVTLDNSLLASTTLTVAVSLILWIIRPCFNDKPKPDEIKRGN
jgi:hypothetical protein